MGGYYLYLGLRLSERSMRRICRCRCRFFRCGFTDSRTLHSTSCGLRRSFFTAFSLVENRSRTNRAVSVFETNAKRKTPSGRARIS